MTLWLGKLQVEIMQLGRGHTKGDTVVWLPQEKILFSGDLVEYEATPYTGDAYLTDWPATLDAIAALKPAEARARPRRRADDAGRRARRAGRHARVRHGDVRLGASAGVALGNDLRTVYNETYATLKPQVRTLGHLRSLPAVRRVARLRRGDGSSRPAHLDGAARQGHVAGAGRLDDDREAQGRAAAGSGARGRDARLSNRLRQRVRHRSGARRAAGRAATRRSARRSASTPSRSRAPPSPRRAATTGAPGCTASARRRCTAVPARSTTARCAQPPFDDVPTPPNQLRWDPLPLPDRRRPTSSTAWSRWRATATPAAQTGVRHPSLRRQPLDAATASSTTPTASC